MASGHQTNCGTRAVMIRVTASQGTQQAVCGAERNGTPLSIYQFRPCTFLPLHRFGGPSCYNDTSSQVYYTNGTKTAQLIVSSALHSFLPVPMARVCQCSPFLSFSLCNHLHQALQRTVCHPAATMAAALPTHEHCTRPISAACGLYAQDNVEHDGSPGAPLVHALAKQASSVHQNHRRVIKRARDPPVCSWEANWTTSRRSISGYETHFIRPSHMIFKIACLSEKACRLTYNIPVLLAI
ncbi:hypothetical protein BC826DRAFT_441057 [Russula brevipes]|nr:hypothetical protein BC826DRAFT_441057 [Russula brevipes]